MKLISHIRKQQVVILHAVEEVMAGGQVREIVPSYIATFKSVRDGGGDLNAEELEAARRMYEGKAVGLNLEMDQHTPVNIMTRLSTYDTNDQENLAAFDAIDRAMQGLEHQSLPRGAKWADGWMKQLTEETLQERSDMQLADDFFVFTPLPLDPPWPTYEDFPGDEEERLGVLLAQGHHLPAVLAYEQQVGKRPDMVTLLEQEIAQLPQLPVDVPGAAVVHG